MVQVEIIDLQFAGKALYNFRFFQFKSLMRCQRHGDVSLEKDQK